MTSRQLRQKAGYLGRKIILHIDFFLNFFAEGVLYFQKSCAQIKLEILFVILFLSLSNSLICEVMCTCFFFFIAFPTFKKHLKVLIFSWIYVLKTKSVIASWIDIGKTVFFRNFWWKFQCFLAGHKTTKKGRGRDSFRRVEYMWK